MRYLLFLLALSIATPAKADTITWFTSGLVQTVSPFADFVVGPGIVQGDPWSLTVSFDPGAAPTMAIFPGCNQYALGPSTLTIGPHSYSHSSGSAYTNAGLPEIGCIGMLPEGLSGLVQFWYGNSGWTSSDPDAPVLSRWGGVTFAGYYDALVKDGTLPVVPTYELRAGWFNTMEIENNAFLGTLIWGGNPQFQLLSPSTAVPEPATLTLFGAGLAALIARRRRR